MRIDTAQPDSSQPELLIVIPAYNAAENLAAVIAGAQPLGLPIVVIDDGSSDDTATVAERAGAEVLRHHANRGKGAALQTGFALGRKRGARAMLTLDADGQHDPAEIPKLIAAYRAQPGSLVLGVRSFDPAIMPRRSRIGNHISTYFISRFAGRPHRDTQTGFRIYPRRLFFAPLRTRRFDTETELLLMAAKLGVPLVEVPIRTIYGTSPSPGTAAAEAVGVDAADAANSETPRHVSHFRNWEDTLRVLGLVISSPWWRLPATASLDGGDL